MDRVNKFMGDYAFLSNFNVGGKRMLNKSASFNTNEEIESLLKEFDENNNTILYGEYKEFDNDLNVIFGQAENLLYFSRYNFKDVCELYQKLFFALSPRSNKIPIVDSQGKNLEFFVYLDDEMKDAMETGFIDYSGRCSSESLNKWSDDFTHLCSSYFNLIGTSNKDNSMKKLWKNVIKVSVPKDNCIILDKSSWEEMVNSSLYDYYNDFDGNTFYSKFLKCLDITVASEYVVLVNYLNKDCVI